MQIVAENRLAVAKVLTGKQDVIMPSLIDIWSRS